MSDLCGARNLNMVFFLAVLDGSSETELGIDDWPAADTHRTENNARYQRSSHFQHYTVGKDTVRPVRDILKDGRLLGPVNGRSFAVRTCDPRHTGAAGSSKIAPTICSPPTWDFLFLNQGQG